MTQTTDTIRVYLNESRQGIIACMHCGQKRTVNMSNYKDNHIGGKALKVKCSHCGKTFNVKFDFRRYHRVNVNFPGKLVHVETKEEIATIVIISLSVGGVGFLFEKNIELSNEDIYEVSFHLDDASHSYICEEVLIKRIHGRCVGAEFYQNDKYNYELDFYLMSEPWSA